MLKLPKYIVVCVASILLVIFIGSCRGHKDCRGRKKTTKTAMGGWL